MLLALTRSEAFSTALRMLTEIGASYIVPVLTERSVANKCKQQRWQRIVQSSAAQSKRLQIPVVYPLHSFSEGRQVVAHLSHRWLCCPSESGDSNWFQCTEAALLIGPEGGFTRAETAQCKEEGWTPAQLSSLVLRADTAAVVAASLFLQEG